MVSDLLHNKGPRRLHRLSGEWVLEIEWIKRLSASRYRPKTDRISGEENILVHLRRDRRYLKLADQANGLFGEFVEETEAEDRSFDCLQGAWVPALVDPDVTAAVRNALAGRSGSEGQLTGGGQAGAGAPDPMTARLEQLEERFNELESFVASGDFTPAPAASGDGSAASAPPSDFEMADDGPSPDAEMAPAPAPSATPEEPPVEAAAPPVDDPAPSGPPMQLPPVPDLSEMLGKLLGDHVSLSQSDALALNEGVGLYVCKLVDEEGAVAGAMIADLNATVRGGGTLIMSDEDEMTMQLEEGSAGADALDAMTEVCNTLNATINRVKGNPHTRAMPMVPFVAAELPWLGQAKTRLDTADTLGGHITFLTR